jgi:rhodanese-related sulfurtransferase
MMATSAHLRDFSPATVHKLMREHSIVLIDVREPQEYVAERIHGALLFPLSTFDPKALPSPAGCEIVFHCGTGKRSAMAAAKCQTAGIAHTAHMAGGIQAWKTAGYPTITLDPASGSVVDRR